MRAWNWSVILMLTSAGASAQSIRMDDDEAGDVVEEPARATQPAAPPEPSPRPAPVITPPKAKSTPVAYPQAGAGKQRVVLDLIIEANGTVRTARAVEGDPPFSNAAVSAAMNWTFEPATEDGVAKAARLRFAVTFEEPIWEEVSEADAAGPVAPDSDVTKGEAPRAKQPSEVKAGERAPIEINVYGDRPVLQRRMSQAEVREMPGAFGDAFRAIEVLPGVVPMMSGVPYFYVRGAPPGNVGYYFDGIPVPLLYHFAAGPGVLHPAFIDRVDLYSGAYPARYGRFAGGIVTADMAPPSYDWRGEASIRLIDSGAMLEAPFADKRGSVMVGGRYSYTGLIISLIEPSLTVAYWDYQGRTRYALDHDDTLEVLIFGSGDLVAEDEGDEVETAIDLQYHRIDLRWDHALEKGNWRNALMFGLDSTEIADGEVALVNRMLGARSEYEQQLSDTINFRAGADALFEVLSQEFDENLNEEEESAPEFVGPVAPMDVPSTMAAPAAMLAMPPPDPGFDEGEDDEIDFGFNNARRDFVFGVRADLQIDVTPRFQLVPGLRTDLFVSGPDVAVGVDPRLSARFEISDDLTLTHGIGVAHQTPSFPIPIPGAKPSLKGGLQRAVQYSAGVEYDLPGGFKSSLVLFNNLFFNMTDLIGLARLAETAELDDENFRMLGRGYGAELMIKRSLTRRLGGFLSYTLSRSERFRGHLRGPSTTDRTHVLNVAGSYDLGANWRFGARGLIYSGIPAEVAYLEAARHPPRTPPFWRLDWRLHKRWLVGEGPGYWQLVLEVLNTTLNEEVLERSCNAYDCVDDSIGPVTIPSIGVEGAF